MALDPRIASLKAAGTYRFEFDKSQVVSIPANQTRLIVGFSKKGPFNTPVFVPDTAFFKQVFGDIDRNLERKDSYFHRSCLAALERGPILALNLLALDSDDNVDYIKLGTAATPEAQNNAGASGEYQKFYNRDKFFFPDSDAFLDNVGANRNVLSSLTTNDLLDFVNLGQNPVSIIVRKAANDNVASFNVTVEEWYGTANVPGFLDKDSLISDFMVDVFVIEGNFGGNFGSATPYDRFTADPTFQQYFNPTKGIQRKKFASDTTDTKLQEFFNESEVNLIATYTACLIPDFVDLLGNNLFIEKLINADTATTGLFCAVNEDLFSGDFLIDGVKGGIDLIGHNIEYTQATGIQDDVNFLSYSEAIVADLPYARAAQGVNLATIATGDIVSVNTLTGGNIQISVIGSAGNPLYDAFASMSANSPTTVGSYIKGAISNKYVPVLSVNVTNTVVTVVLSGVGGIVSGDFPTSLGTTYTYVNEEDLGFTVHEFETSNTNANIIGSYGSALYSSFSNGTLTDGDEAVWEISGNEYISYLVFNATGYGFIHTGVPATVSTKFAISDPAYYIPGVRVTPYQQDTFVSVTPRSQFNMDSGTGFFLTSDGASVALNTLDIQTLKGSLNRSIDIIADSSSEPLLKPNQVLIASTNPDASTVVVGNYLLHFEGNISTPHSRLTRINQVQGGKTSNQFPTIPVGTTALLVTCQSEINVTTVNSIKKVELYYPIDSWVDYLNIFTLDGFVLDVNKHVPNGTNERQNAILNGTLNGTNLFKALTDRETINFRYVVDTFGNGIESGSKAIYTNLCQTRKNAFAIINAPSAKDFKANTDPSFVDASGALSSRFISTGGDLSKNPTVRYSLPSSTQGGSWGGFYYPFITIRDLGKNINVPPAAYVSNNFIAKYENALPWSLVAGVRRGVVGGTGVVGLELNLDLSDREYLEPFGLNPIIFQSGTGPTIFANKTAQQTPKSALSSINVREVVIYIQDGIEAILKNYLFEFNTAQTRLEIKTLADNFLSTVQNDDGVYDFRNVMDETNNTPEVIDQNVGILDTYIEPVRGMEILVQRTTILRTGAISSGNFQ
jgi:hypothetical protein